MPAVVQFGSGPLSLIDPTQAPPGKHTTYAWHVMPLEPDTGGKDYEAFKEEFSEKILQTWARYCPNMTAKETSSADTPIRRANTSRNSPTCATATSSWARSTPSR